MTSAPRKGRTQARGTYSAVKLVSPAEPNAVTALRHRATAFAEESGAGPELAEDVALAVSEAITNVVKYAYGPEGGTVEFSAAAEKGWLEICVRDQGNGFADGNSPASGLGIGLALIADLCTDLAITQESTGTEVRMRWVLPAAD
ncbi:MAG TPA: ATP-binding protein [Solirubrobacterales bacterium]|nr:ATP-binding protein [Solirubrobacterales bacterium]